MFKWIDKLLDKIEASNETYVKIAVSDKQKREDDIERTAREMLEGKWGNKQTVRHNLTQAGYNYFVIAKKAKELEGKK